MDGREDAGTHSEPKCCRNWSVCCWGLITCSAAPISVCWNLMWQVTRWGLWEANRSCRWSLLNVIGALARQPTELPRPPTLWLWVRIGKRTLTEWTTPAPQPPELWEIDAGCCWAPRLWYSVVTHKRDWPLSTDFSSYVGQNPSQLSMLQVFVKCVSSLWSLGLPHAAFPRSRTEAVTWTVTTQAGPPSPAPTGAAGSRHCH